MSALAATVATRRPRRPELWSSHVGTMDWREWRSLHARLRERVAVGQLPDMLVTLEHPGAEGRLVGYVIVDVEDPVPAARRVEDGVLGALAALGVRPHPRLEHSAIWVRDCRIGLLAGGDRFAIDVDPPATGRHTSVRREAGPHVGLHDVRRALMDSLSRAHVREGLEVAPEWLGRPAG
jgi:hypothetical protein